MKRLAEETTYGEGQGDAANLRTRVYQVKDGAGVLTNQQRNPQTGKDEAYDFKGNLLWSNRRLLLDYIGPANWDAHPPLEPGNGYDVHTVYDALARPTSMTTADGSVYHPTFNEANLLERVDMSLAAVAAPTPFVTNINYNAKGQRVLIVYGNDVTTEYTYDSDTFRLTHLVTTRPATVAAGQRTAQDLAYTYDPVGNITRIVDHAQPRVNFDNDCVDASNDYQYDALYRLVGATGREHPGLDRQPGCDDTPRLGNPIPYSNQQALRRYAELYQYDAVGNILDMIHHLGDNLSNPGAVVWHQRYQYRPDNNHLRCTSVPGEAAQPEYSTDPNAQYASRYTYDEHGNMTSMPHLADLSWDFEDQLQSIDLGGGGRAYYTYDAAGQRVRKVIHRQNGTRQNERIYLGVYEIYREYNGDGTTRALERETLHVMDNRERIALVETRTFGNDPVPQQLIRYQHGNHLGSVCLELGDQAQPLSYEECYPCGSTSYQAGLPTRFRYTGKERDEESGLCYFGDRYSASWLGRWISCDRMPVHSEASGYAFARCNPINFIDVQGDFECYWNEVHETISTEALRRVVARSHGTQSRTEMNAFRRGVYQGSYYPDIPESAPKTVRMHSQPPNSLTFRSHLGDLQYWHSMSPAGATSATEVRDQILLQAFEWYSKGAEAIARDPRTAGNYLGRVLHMVQDSWAQSHTERDANGKILGFQDYTKQIEGEHARAEGSEGPFGQQRNEESWTDVQNIPGTIQAFEVSMKLIDAFLNRDVDEFMRIMEDDYTLAEGAYVGRSQKDAPWTKPESPPQQQIPDQTPADQEHGASQREQERIDASWIRAGYC